MAKDSKRLEKRLENPLAEIAAHENVDELRRGKGFHTDASKRGIEFNGYDPNKGIMTLKCHARCPVGSVVHLILNDLSAEKAEAVKLYVDEVSDKYFP